MREETTTRTLYTFQELSPEAQQKAIEAYQERAGVYDDSEEGVYDYAAAIADIMGLDINTRQGKNGNYSPNIYYSGFWSQGDGACFEGTYSFKAGSVKAIKAYAPQDTELHSIALALQHAQAANFYKVSATIKHRGHYYHSGCMAIELEHQDDSCRDIKNEDDFKQAFRDFADWIYSSLETEYNYETSEEAAREYLQDDTEYTIDGARA